MNHAEAKQILLLHRPGNRGSEDPDMIEAMELARQDPALAEWFEQHKAFQTAMRAKFRQIEAPARLKHAILATQKIVRPAAFWQQPAWIAAAAVLVLLLGLAALFRPRTVPDRFADYRETVVSEAVRVYGMDLTTSDRTQLREFLAKRGAPADYELSQGLERLQLKGGGLLRWRSNPVSMVCFDRGGNNMLFLFVLKRSALKDAPPAANSPPQLAQVDGLITASWSHGNDTYVLAGPQEPGFSQKYVQ